MKEEFQTEDEISLLDIVRTLFERIKLLIIVVLIGGVLGGSIAVAATIEVDYWGSTVEFYVNPESSEEEIGENSSQYGVYGAYGRHVMDNMVKLLSSESFTEKLILNGKTLPEKDVWVNKDSKDEVALQLDEKIDLAAAEIENAKLTTAAVDVAKIAYNDAVLNYNEGLKKLNDEWKKLPLAWDLSATFNEREYLHIVSTKQETEYAAVKAEYEKVYQPLDTTQVSLEAAVESTKEALQLASAEEKKAFDAAEAQVEIALNAWRETAKYQDQLSKYSSAVTYSYLQAEEDVEDANNLARSFIYVTISVLNDKAFAEEILERVKVVVPAYVKENMTVPSGYIGTKCQRITRSDDIALTNPGYTTNEAIKWAILAAAAFGVIAAVIVIIVDRSDKRLKECELLTKKFDLPILGIIPTIDVIVGEANTKEAKK